MQPNSPAEICSGGFRKTFNAYLAMNRLPLNRIQPNADAHLVIFTMDNRGSLAAGISPFMVKRYLIRFAIQQELRSHNIHNDRFIILVYYLNSSIISTISFINYVY